jgi:hypothetical protein
MLAIGKASEANLVAGIVQLDFIRLAGPVPARKGAGTVRRASPHIAVVIELRAVGISWRYINQSMVEQGRQSCTAPPGNSCQIYLMEFFTLGIASGSRKLQVPSEGGGFGRNTPRRPN